MSAIQKVITPFDFCSRDFSRTTQSGYVCMFELRHEHGQFIINIDRMQQKRKKKQKEFEKRQLETEKRNKTHERRNDDDKWNGATKTEKNASTVRTAFANELCDLQCIDFYQTYIHSYTAHDVVA